MADVFISYSHAEAGIAAAVAAGLEARGYTTWRFEEKSRLGGSYLERIAKEIRECRAALFVISASSLASPQCKAELVRSHELGKALLPLRCGISHADLVASSDEWGLALKGAVTAEVTPETADAVAGEAAATLREQRVLPGEPPALPGSPLARLSRGAVRGIAPKDTPLGGAVAAIVGGLGLPYTLYHLARAFSPPAGDPEAWVLATFPGFRSATLLVNAAGALQNALLLYGAWLVHRRDARGGPLLRKVSLSMLITVGLWLLVALALFSGPAATADPAIHSALIGGAITAALFALAPSSLVFALFRRSRRESGP
jgi:hypothetical protein